jgi:peptidoglycan/LPS O-acetylase OafA/YrhL
VSSAKTNPNVNLQALDSLRGLLAVYVVAGHARWLLWAGHSEWSSHQHPGWQNLLAYSSALLRYGHEAVIGFFVLSGFFIHLRAAKGLATQATPTLELSSYTKRRAHRLLPPYALALVVTVLFDGIGGHFWPSLYYAAAGDDLLKSSFSRMGYGTESIAPALMVLPFSLGQHFGTNGPLWSLGYEVVYYALYPLWFALRKRLGFLAYLALPLSLVGGSVFGSGWSGLVISHYAVWLAGAALAEWLTGAKAPKAQLAPVLALMAGIAFGLHHLPAMKGLLPSLILAVVYGAGLVGSLALSLPRFNSLMPIRYLEFFGVRSYTLYIVHFPLLVLLSAWILHDGGNRPMSGWLALGGFGAALGFGCLCFHLCERHFLHERIRIA